MVDANPTAFKDDAVNWLAHALLSEADPQSRLGNVLADLVKGSDLAAMPEGFLMGVRRHHAIDAFTDSHPLVRESRSRLGEGYRHCRGIIIDVFYDHILARNWSLYCHESLEMFTASVYRELRAQRGSLPGSIRGVVDRILAEDWLMSYRSIAGVETTLRRVSHRLATRLGRPFALERAMPALQQHFTALESDFAQFFPMLRAHVENRSAACRAATGWPVSAGNSPASSPSLPMPGFLR